MRRIFLNIAIWKNQGKPEKNFYPIKKNKKHYGE
jgi:hypothetical protein